MANREELRKPQWVALSILDFARIVHDFGDDAESLCKWVKKFAEDLLYCNDENGDEFAKRLLNEAKEKTEKLSAAGKKGGKTSAKKRKISGSAKPATGSALDKPNTDKRENGDDNTANASSGCGPEPDNLSGDALDGNTSDGNHTLAREGLSDRTTVSDHFEARQGQNATEDAAIREDSENIHYAPSGQPVSTRCGSLESGTSSAASIYDQETETGNDSTDEARQGQTGAGAPSVREKCCHDAPAPHGTRRGKPKPPKNAAEVVAWAADHGIDEVDARDWYELNFVIRPGCDKDGVVIENWPGHCISYCRAVKEKRESA